MLFRALRESLAAVRSRQIALIIFENCSNPVTILLTAAYGVLWLGGVASYLLLGEPPEQSRWAAPAFLYVGAALALALAGRGARARLLVAGAIGLAAEILGLRLGFPFGHYVYTGVLGAGVLGAPLAIGCAWLILFAYVDRMMRRLDWSRLWRAPAGAAWLVVLDLLIDPLAAGPLGFWFWPGGGPYYGVPLLNFAGWFGVGLLLFVLPGGTSGRAPGLERLGLSIVLFFLFIGLTHAMAGPIAAGLFLCLLHGRLHYEGNIEPQSSKERKASAENSVPSG